MNDLIRLTPRLCRAARGLLGWTQESLAERSGVAYDTISGFERRESKTAKLTNLNNRAVVQAFEAAGILFIPENGGGTGVRLRDRES
jgi:transcriptional regulator with XRE-family HTH domain